MFLCFFLIFSFFLFFFLFPFPSLSLHVYLFLFLFLCIFRFLLLGGAAWSLPSSGGVSGFPSPVWWCSLPSSSFGWGVFCWVVLLGFLLPFGCVLFFLFLLVGWCCLVSSFLGVVFLAFYVVLLGFFLLVALSCLVVLPSIPPLGSGAFLLSSVGWCCLFPSLALFSFHFTWCCLVSSLFGWSLLFGGAAFHLLLWDVVLVSSLLLGGATRFSFLGWCCCFPSPVWWCCLRSPLCVVFCWVVLLGLVHIQRTKGRQHQAKGEEKRNTTQRRRKPSSTMNRRHAHTQIYINKFKNSK